jgi:hypothetical protein
VADRDWGWQGRIGEGLERYLRADADRIADWQ